MQLRQEAFFARGPARRELMVVRRLITRRGANPVAAVVARVAATWRVVVPLTPVALAVTPATATPTNQRACEPAELVAHTLEPEEQPVPTASEASPATAAAAARRTAAIGLASATGLTATFGFAATPRLDTAGDFTAPAGGLAATVRARANIDSWSSAIAAAGPLLQGHAPPPASAGGLAATIGLNAVAAGLHRAPDVAPAGGSTTTAWKGRAAH